MTVQGGHVPNKAEFIEELAGRLQTDKKQAGMILDTVLDSIYAHVAKGEKVVLTGFGIFEKRDRAARVARNPATGASVRVKKTSVPAFRPGAEFKAITSGAKKVTKSAAAKKAAPAVRKSTASRAPAKKAAPAKTATKAPAAKAPARRAPARKAPATKAPATKAPAAKAPAKTAAAKRAPAKKAR
jgi:DNA-binding protein HU-beta